MPHISPHVTLNNPAFIHDSALLFGKVTIGQGASIWPHVVTRAEIHEIVIGERTNVQDHVMVHVGLGSPTLIGADCSITHRVMLHGCEIGDRVLIGIGATVMDAAKIGSNSIVAGHSIVTEGIEFPDNSIIAGSPARLVRTRDNGAANLLNARFYYQNALNYAKGVDRLTPEQMTRIVNG